MSSTKLPSFAAIDFETANSSADSACALGVAVVRNGSLVDSFQRLIRPPSNDFSPWNFRVHGIDWSRVASEPDFASVWAEVQPAVEGAEFFVAHNAGFDQRILGGCCDHYGLEPPAMDFVCTVEVASAMWQLDSYTLDRVSRYLGIPLKHHQAQSDAEASASVLLRALADGYDLAAPRRSSATEWASKRLSAEVQAVAAAIMEDMRVDPDEVLYLSRWLEQHEEVTTVWPGSQMASLTRAILSDGTVDESELEQVRELCMAILGLKERKKSRRAGKKGIGGIAVCFTGFGPGKLELQDEAEAAGFRVACSIIKALDILVIGPEPGPSKLEKAKNQNVRILSLDEWREFMATRSKSRSATPQVAAEASEGNVARNGGKPA